MASPDMQTGPLTAVNMNVPAATAAVTESGTSLSVDAPGAYMRDRVQRTVTSRTAWIGMLRPLIKSSTDEVQRRRQASASLRKDVDAEAFLPLKSAAASLADAWSASAATLEEMTEEHVNKRVMAPVSAYEAMSIRPTLAMLSDREAAFVDAKKAVDAFNAQKLRGGGARLRDVEHRAIQARRRAHNTHVLFEEHAQLFEYKRVTDKKLWLQQVIMAEMAYHCSCLQLLTHALQETSKVAPDDAMDALRDRLMHTGVSPADVAAAAGEHSQPFQGMVVPPELRSAAAAFAGTSAAPVPEAVTLAAAEATKAAQPLRPPPIVTATSPVVRATSQQAAPTPAAPVAISSGAVTASEAPAQSVWSTRANVANVDGASPPSAVALPPGAQQALASMPQPLPASTSGVAASRPPTPRATTADAASSAPPPAPAAAPASAPAPSAGLFGRLFGRGRSPSPGAAPATPAAASATASEPASTATPSAATTDYGPTSSR